MSAFRSGLPITLTSFINKSGEIGLSLLPIVLVERHASIAESSFILGFVKFALPLGILYGGWISDRIGARTVYLFSFGCSAVGLVLIPFCQPLWLVCLAALLAQTGKALFTPSSRILLTALVPNDQRREALGWFRTGNNLGQIISYSLGALFAHFGTTIFFLFDGFTSFLAFLMGFRWLPKEFLAQSQQLTDPKSTLRSLLTGGPILRLSIAIGGFNALYELYTISIAAKLKIVHPENGLFLFSSSMVINTILCTLLAVPAAKYFKSPLKVLSSGLTIIALGGAVTFINPESIPLVFFGVFLATVGEIIFASLAQFVLLGATSKFQKPGTAYGMAMTLQASIRVISGIIAFPLVVHAKYPYLPFIIILIPALFMLWSSREMLEQNS